MTCDILCFGRKSLAATMLASVYNAKLARTVLLIQLVTFSLISALFVLKNGTWVVFALAGGLAAWLPNVLFMFLVLRLQAQNLVKGCVAWSFVFGEILKVFATIIFFIVSLGVFKAVFWPLAITWLSVLIVHSFAPVVINNKS